MLPRTMPRLVTVLAMAAAAAACNGASNPTSPSALLLGVGNGAPSGAHYNLNIIGVPKGKSADMTGDNGHRIFVNLDKSGTKPGDKIYLYPSPDGTFQVLDANGTDGQASFELPAPGTYTIWARAVGTPGGSASIYDCVIYDNVEYCPTTASLTMTRNSGKVAQFQNVTSELLTFDISYNSDLVDACGSTSVPLFDSCLQGYFWNYDNNGLKVLQLRFYSD